MTEKLSFQDLQNTCDALGTFANARLQEKPNKDIILTIEKINGRDVLQATKLSEMTWNARFVRLFGSGGSTLTSVSHFLQKNEPWLPSFNRRHFLSSHYTEEAVETLTI